MTTDADIDACKFMIERGTVASDKWVPAPEDLKEDMKASKIEALRSLVDDSRALRDPAFVDDIETFIKNDGQVFEIKKDATGKYHVFMKEAFAERLIVLDALVKKLAVGMLDTIPNSKNQYINAANNQISIFDGGRQVVTLSGASLLNESLFNDTGSSGYYTIADFENSTASTTIYSDQRFEALRVGSTIHIQSKLTARAEYGNSYLIPPILAGTASVTLKLMYRTNSSSSWVARETIASVSGRNSVNVDRYISVEAGGDYCLQFEYWAQPNSSGSLSYAGASSTKFSYKYLDSTNMEAWYCSNGLGLRGNIDNYFRAMFTNKVMSLTIKGQTSIIGTNLGADNGGIIMQVPKDKAPDMPGVLRAGSVGIYGSNDGSWGFKKAAPRRTGQGKYTITHNIGHYNYYFSATLRSAFTGAVKILNKQSNYIEVEVRGLNDGLYDCPFDYIICGTNYDY